MVNGHETFADYHAYNRSQCSTSTWSTRKNETIFAVIDV